MRYNEHEIAVSRGAALLDEKYPGWWREINLDILELDSCFHCALGQLYGSYEKAFPKLNIGGYFDPKTWEYGFSIPALLEGRLDERCCQWGNLTATWKSLIVARRAAE